MGEVRRVTMWGRGLEICVVILQLLLGIQGKPPEDVSTAVV